MKLSKTLWRVSVKTTAEAEDAVGELLASRLGAATAAYFDMETGISTVSVFQDRKPAAALVRKQLAAGLKHVAACGLKVEPGKIELTRIRRQDWAESWKRHFRPQQFGPELLVKPSWSKIRPRKNQAVLVLDPGLSFGTGQHPTTSFCLAEVVRFHRQPLPGAKKAAFLDIGTGSGILAIAATKLGFSPVHAFDFDPEAVRVARENARKNSAAGRCKITRGDITRLRLRAARQYDLVCANLISNLLVAERSRIVNRLKPAGTLVLAGILAAEFPEVQAAFESLGLKLVRRRIENEWCSGAFCFS